MATFSSLGPYDGGVDPRGGPRPARGYDLHGASIRNANGDAARRSPSIRLLTHQRRRWRYCGVFYRREIMDFATP
jgi:hypothetical protein